MAGCISLLMEILSIILCIYNLYGKKFQIDVKSVIVIGIDTMLLQCINEGILPSQMTVLLYPLIVCYCIAEFGFHKKELIVNNILYMVILGVTQIGVCKVLEILHIVRVSNVGTGINSLLVNGFVLLIVFFVFSRIGLHQFAVFMQQKVILLRVILVVAFLFVVYMILVMKTMDVLTEEHYVVITISLCLLGSVTYMWQKNQYKVREQKMELQMHHIYSESFQNMVTDIRKRQHDFQNHLNTIYNLHYTCSTLEEMVKQQTAYVEAIQEENRYNKLLSNGNPVITGFLYGKFLQADKKGIEIIYNVKIANLESNMPAHKLVEMIGNLFDNAMEAIELNKVEKVIYLDFIETPETIDFKIRNENSYIPQEQLIKMFERGQSSKGEYRGLGLANVKQICEEYKWELQVHNRKTEQKKTYIEFEISRKR